MRHYNHQNLQTTFFLWEKYADCQSVIKKEGLKDEHELQSYFIGRIQEILQKKGREAAQAGAEVVMSPTAHCYLDYTYLP